MVTKSDTPRYVSSAMEERLESHAYHLAIARNPDTIQKEEILDAFFDHVKDNFELDNEQLSDLSALINDFLGYDVKKAEQGELELLKRWNQSVKGA